jgi:hypothetical protein
MTRTSSTPLIGLAALAALSFAGCGQPQYAGAACSALRPGASVAGLPLVATEPLPDHAWLLSDPFIAGTAELACCANNTYFTPAAPANCAEVDCVALRTRLSRSMLGGAYEGETCGPRQGASSCWVYFEGERIVGVQAFCAD